MTQWSKEDLEEMCGDDVIDQLAFLAGCNKHRRTTAQRKAQNRPEVLAAQSAAHKGAKHGMYDHTVYIFEHTDGRVVHSTRFDFENMYNLPTNSVGKLVRGEQKTSVGWKLVGKE